MSNFNPNFDREKLAFLELANRGNGLDPISYMYCKSGSFENILTAIIKGGTAELYMLYAHGIDVKYLEVLQLKAGDIKANTIEVNTITSDTINNTGSITTYDLQVEHKFEVGFDENKPGLATIYGPFEVLLGPASFDVALLTAICGTLTSFATPLFSINAPEVAINAIESLAPGLVQLYGGTSISISAPAVNIGRTISAKFGANTDIINIDSIKSINISTGIVDLINNHISMVSPIINIGADPGNKLTTFQAKIINLSTANLAFSEKVSEIENINIQTSKLKPLSNISMLAPIINIGAFAGVEDFFQAKEINITTAALVPSIVSANEKITIQTSNLDPINNVSIYSRIINIGDDRGIDIGTNTINIQTNKVPATSDNINIKSTEINIGSSEKTSTINIQTNKVSAISDNINIKSTEINIGSSEKTSTINITTLVNESTINIGDRTTTEINLRTNFLANNAVLTLESPTINIGSLQTGYINLITANEIAGFINIGSSTINIGLDINNNPVAKQITIQTSTVDPENKIALSAPKIDIGTKETTTLDIEASKVTISGVDSMIMLAPDMTIGGSTSTDSMNISAVGAITISGDTINLTTPKIIASGNLTVTEDVTATSINSTGLVKGRSFQFGAITFEDNSTRQCTYTWPSPPVSAPIPGFEMNYLDCESLTGILNWKFRSLEILDPAPSFITFLQCNNGVLNWRHEEIPGTLSRPLGEPFVHEIINHLSCEGTTGILSWKNSTLRGIGTAPIIKSLKVGKSIGVKGKIYAIPPYEGNA